MAYNQFIDLRMIIVITVERAAPMREFASESSTMKKWRGLIIEYQASGASADLAPPHRELHGSL
jgi:hypothetical protein